MKKSKSLANTKGRIIGYNDNSGLLYINDNGLSQFKPSKNVISKPVDYTLYRNKENTKRTMEDMNSEKGNPPDFYEGKNKKIKIDIEPQPAPFTILKGEPQ